jgi:hypothetical protein
MPATPWFDLLYCLVLDETTDRVERRQDLDDVLASAVADGKPDRSSWGLRPEHQRRMRSAIEAGGAGARANRRPPRVAGRR